MSNRFIMISLPRHEILVFENGKEIHPRIHNFSTGRLHHETPPGNYWISPNRRLAHHSSNLYNDSSGRRAQMPFSLFLDAIKSNEHGFRSRPTAIAFHAGDPNIASHGCIHLSMTDARWLFHWAGGYDVHVTILGTPAPEHNSSH